MTMRTLLPILTLALISGAPALAAQEGGPPPPPPGTPPTELVFEREVFSYPAFDRRNPFARLSANSAGGPRFSQIALRTIIYSSNPQNSLAIFNSGGNLPSAQGTEIQAENLGETRRLRVGEGWGNMRVVEIQRDRVIVSVEEFGIAETHTMMIPRAGRQGGS